MYPLLSDAAATAWASLGVALIAAVGTCLAAFLAHRAEKNTRPISNGFAKDTTDALKDNTGRLDRIECLLLRHLEDHAASDLRHYQRKRP